MLWFMQRPETTSTSTARQKEYARLAAQLARIGWISEGYVQDRGRGAGAPSRTPSAKCSA